LIGEDVYYKIMKDLLHSSVIASIYYFQ